MIVPRLASAMRRTGRILFERPRITLWTLAALTCALVLVGVAALAALKADKWNAEPGSGATMVVYLGEGVDDAHAQQLVAQLGKLPGVEHAELVPAAESAKRLQSALGADSALLEGVEVGSLPPTVEVALQPGMRDVIALSPTVTALKGSPGIDDVIVEDGGNARVASSLTEARSIAWAIAGIMAVLAIAIVVAATRIRMEKSAREASVLELLGASPWFMGVPTALAGMMQGAIAAVLAFLVLSIGLTLYVPIDPPALAQIVMFVGIGAALGLVGGGFAGASRATR
ncbi:MAG TPA: permease-like cell division protein FtsX [Kofleriaceae bacterium]|nr:permease-like cell division protein FtsX [Kofleriaceae bacterium]